MNQCHGDSIGVIVACVRGGWFTDMDAGGLPGGGTYGGSGVNTTGAVALERWHCSLPGR